jgi:hypothetical protein
MTIKLILLSILVSATLVNETVAQNLPPYVPTNGLVGWWPFNGNANDESGNANNGTVLGPTVSNGRFGIPSSAYDFSGTDSRIDVDSINSQIFNGDFTISIFALFRNFNAFYPYLFQSAKYGVANTLDIHGLGPPYGANQGKVAFIFMDSTGTGPTLFTNANSTNSWHQFCLMRKGDSLFAIKNGLRVDKVSIPGFRVKKLKGLIFGRGNGNSGVGDGLQQNLDGRIDEIGLWNRALSTEEIKNIYNSGLCFQTVSVTDTLFINTGLSGFSPVTYFNTIKIYPNPTNNQITIDNGNITNLSGYQLKITNSLGQQVFQSGITQQQFIVDLSTWTGNGIYFVHVVDGQGNTLEIRKIVLQ